MFELGWRAIEDIAGLKNWSVSDRKSNRLRVATGLTSLGDITLASGWETDHDHTDPGIFGLDTDAVGSRRHLD